MRTVEVRRHAERADRGDEESALTERGRQMCAALARRAGGYALVVSSPPPRAKETAELIGGRLDRVEPRLLPPMEELPQGFWERLSGISGYVELVRSHEAARRVAEEQAALWAELAAEVADGERVLAISHGGVVELGTAAVCERLRPALEGPTFGLCEGVLVSYDGDAPAAIEALRSPKEA